MDKQYKASLTVESNPSTRNKKGKDKMKNKCLCASENGVTCRSKVPFIGRDIGICVI